MTTKKAADSGESRSRAANGANTEKKLRNLRPPWQKGQSGNPNGRPKKDLAAQIAEQLFADNTELIARAMLKQLKKGNAKVYQVLADRAWGKAHQQIDLTGSLTVSVVVDL